MKNIFNFKSVIVVLTLLMSCVSVAQKKHTITLHVDTEKINMTNVEKTCNFGQDPNIPNEVYTIDVSVRDTIVWVGKSKNNKDVVHVKKIIYSSGTNFFDRKKLRDKDGVVTGVVIINEPDAYEKYEIEFKVKRNGEWLDDTFPIDPKLRMRPSLRQED